MTKIKKVTTPSEIDLTKYVDSDTGETLVDNLPEGTSLSVKKDSGLRTIDCDNYAVLETEAMLVLMDVLNNSDLANVLKMSVTTKTPMNVVFNENIPHTHDTLQKYLMIESKSMFLKLIKRLIQVGVLYQIKGRIYGEVRVCYMLNPFLSRKRKLFESKVFDVFEKFKLEK